jgi:hypothetical protein
MRVKRLFVVLALTAGAVVGVAPAVAAPIASAFGGSPGASAPDNGTTTLAGSTGRRW